jgi:hypothetical protein
MAFDAYVYSEKRREAMGIIDLLAVEAKNKADYLSLYEILHEMVPRYIDMHGAVMNYLKSI